MEKNLSVYCIIPAYNEEKNIVATIQKVKPFVNKIIVVDDASRDNTYQLAKSQKVTVLKHIINRGQGAALQTGTQYALKNQADVIVHFDADGQFLAEEINSLIKPLSANQADIAIGSRFLEKKSKIPFFKNFFIIPSARIINKIFFNINLTDPQSGFRALSRKAAQLITIENDGAAHCNEIISKALKYKLKIKEVPTTVIYNNFGQSIFNGKGRKTGGIQIIKDLIIEKFINQN